MDDSESGGPRFESRHSHLRKSACAVGQDTLPKVLLDNHHLLSLDYEYGNGALEYVNIVKAPYKFSNLHFLHLKGSVTELYSMFCILSYIWCKS